MPEPINVKCPSYDQILAPADESGLVNILREHLYEEHALEMPPERVKGERRRPVARIRRLQRPTCQRSLMSRLEREARQEARAIG